MRRAASIALLVLGGLLSAPTVANTKPDAGQRTFNPGAVRDRDALIGVLKAHVAYLRVNFKPRKDELASVDERDGFGIVIDDRMVAALSFIVERATKVQVVGPKGAVRGKVVLYDIERRVALIETETSVSKAGLEPAKIAWKKDRSFDQTVYAILSTTEHPAIANGVLTDADDTPEFGGLLRTDLLLKHGMPVFDDQARFVGYSRTVGWDADKFFLVPMEIIREARTATGAPAKKALEEAARKKKQKRPWWVR